MILRVGLNYSKITIAPQKLTWTGGHTSPTEPSSDKFDIDEKDKENRPFTSAKKVLDDSSVNLSSESGYFTKPTSLRKVCASFFGKTAFIADCVTFSHVRMQVMQSQAKMMDLERTEPVLLSTLAEDRQSSGGLACRTLMTTNTGRMLRLRSRLIMVCHIKPCYIHEHIRYDIYSSCKCCYLTTYKSRRLHRA